MGAFAPIGIEQSIVAGYAFDYRVEPGSWDFSVPVFAGYTYAEAHDFPGEVGYPDGQYLKMATAGVRAMWSYSADRHVTFELSLGVSGSWVVSRRIEPYADPPIRYWVKLPLIFGLGFG
jgi:hypothetical protein